jgi:gamma-glutamyltranspeptidase/glutathione hydrolase
LLTLEALAILKALKWGHSRQSPEEATHAKLEALRLAWKDRGDYFGDPQFVDVPVKPLLSKDYVHEQADIVRAAVKAKKALSLKLERIEAIGTLHISAVDPQGNYASLTLTQGSSYGAQVSVESLGVVLGQGMARFDPRPGHPNSIAPNKRPVHNMAPCVLLRKKKPILAVGAAGGTKIPNSLYDFFSHYLAQNKSMEESLDAPRMNCIGAPSVMLEKAWPKSEADYLKQIGFKVTEGLGAITCAVTLDPKTKVARGKTRLGNPFQESPNEK